VRSRALPWLISTPRASQSTKSQALDPTTVARSPLPPPHVALHDRHTYTHTTTKPRPIQQLQHPPTQDQKQSELSRPPCRRPTQCRPICASRSPPRGARPARATATSARPCTPPPSPPATFPAPRRPRSAPWRATAASPRRPRLRLPRRRPRRPCRANHPVPPGALETDDDFDFSTLQNPSQIRQILRMRLSWLES